MVDWESVQTSTFLRGVALNDVFAQIEFVHCTDGAARWAAYINNVINPATPGAATNISVRNLTTSSITLVAGVVDVTLVTK